MVHTEQAEPIALDEGPIASPTKRTSLAFLMLCAWNNVDPRQAPPEWWSHPSDANRLGWERVAAAALDWLTMLEDGHAETRHDMNPDLEKRK